MADVRGDGYTDGMQFFSDTGSPQPPAYRVFSMADGAEAPTQEPTDSSCQLLGVDADHVYCLAGGDFVSYPKAGGTGVTIASVIQRLRDWTLDDTHLYWIDGGDSTGKYVFKVPLEGGARVTLVKGSAAASTVAVDGDSLYWTESDSQTRNGGVMKLTPK
jgi:hypothetical protein